MIFVPIYSQIIDFIVGSKPKVESKQKRLEYVTYKYFLMGNKEKVQLTKILPTNATIRVR